MTPTVQLNEETGHYELGATIDGAWIVFVTIPATQVEATVANSKAAADAGGQAQQ